MAEERRLPRPAHVLGGGSAFVRQDRPDQGFIDGSFTAAKKGGSVIDPTKRGKGNKIMAIVDRRSLPLAVHVACASPHEVRLVDGVSSRELPLSVRVLMT